MIFWVIGSLHDCYMFWKHLILRVKKLNSEPLWDLTRNTFHLYGKTGESFLPNETVQLLECFPLVWKKKVRIFRQMEQHRFLQFWDNKPHYFFVVQVWWGKWFSDILVVSVKMRKVEYMWGYIISLFREISTGKDCMNDKYFHAKIKCASISGCMWQQLQSGIILKYCTCTDPN